MIKKKIASCLSATIATVVITANAYAAEITFPDVPLFLKEELAPNIILTLDNSTSMQRADIFDASVFCPDVNTSDTDNPTGKTVFRTCWTDPGLNKIYYNPDIIYQLPLNADGTSYPNATFTDASVDGFNPTAARINLATEYIPTYNYLRRKDEPVVHEFVDFELNNKRAYYASFDVTTDPDENTAFNECESVGNNYNTDVADSCFTINSISASEEQNFANWYSYYRNRLLVTKSAASIAFELIGGDIRVGWNDINILKSFNIDDANYVSPFTSQHKVKFYDWLASMNQDFGTPLIPALQTVGEYVSSTDHLNPFAVTPGSPLDEYDPATDLSCRQNYNVMFTDGAWSYNASIVTPDTDFDNITTTLPDETVFTAGTPPYSAPSPAAGFLADWSFYYWSRDLRPDLDNTLTPFIADPDLNETATEQFFNPANDPATWQHLVNYTVSLGVDGNLAYPESLDGLIDGSIDWPTNGSSEPTRIDDTWHTAINSRGDYFSASNTTELTDAFTEILNRIISSNASASAISADSTQAADTEFLYRAGFSSGDWGGTLQGFTFTNLTIGAIQFDAGCQLTGGDCDSTGEQNINALQPANRRIITSSGVSIDNTGVNTTTGIPFQGDALTATQIALLDPVAGSPQALAIGDYIRGGRSNEEQNGGTFRERENVLGDIINSSPALVVTPQRVYPNRGNWEDRWNNLSGLELTENSVIPDDTNSFGVFTSQAAITERQGIVYVGANDGMLHAFNGVTGVEEFAYIPSVLIPKLNLLTDPDYTHQFFVDGTPNAGEAYFSSENAWHTVLTGHLRSGGRMVYALDVTNEPAANADEDDISDRLLWEFTHKDLGFGNGEPQIARLHNGEWAAIFGNGYNSHQEDLNGETGTGTASIFIVNIETGDLIKQIDTGNGGSTTNTANGIGSVTTVDADGDFITDFVYGGDLNGNLWKFDLTNLATNDWRVAHTNSSGEPEPFFTAASPTGEAQAITEMPTVINVVANGEDVGVLVIFGTGKFLEEADNFDTEVVNSFYGVWDRDVKKVDEVQGTLIVPAITRDDLTLRTLSANQLNAGGDTTVRTIDGDDVDFTTDTPSKVGWYFDFFAGELQFTESLIFDDSLVNFTTFEPMVDECTRGGVSFLYVIDAFQGKDPGFTPIDVNGDNFFDENDDVGSNSFVSAIQLEGSGVIAPITILTNGSETNDNGVENFASIQFNTTEAVVGSVAVKNQLASNGGRVQWRQIK